MRIRHISIVVMTLMGVFILNACGGQKKKGEISKTKMFIHNLTSKYNGYFNANELMEFSELALSDSHSDNYNQILEVYSYVDVENPKMVAADLDKAIEKVTTVASLHRPSHWLDDCYVLLGKAQYLKHDYESAEETFEYFEEEFDPRNPFGSNFHKKKKTKKQKKKEREAAKKEKQKAQKKAQKAKKKERAKKKKKKKGRRLTKREKEVLLAAEKLEKEKQLLETKLAEDAKAEKEKKKKSDEAKKPGLFKHKPIYNEGLLWLAKTYIARQKWSSARSILKKIENSKYYKPRELEKEIIITYADMHLKQKKYDEAILYLTKGIALAKDKKDKSRYNYILAQLYDKKGDYSYAKIYYEKVMKMHPSYEMEFNATLNLYKTDMLSGATSGDQVVSKLEKMIKEEKNIDFRDQLYFTLGQLELHKPNIQEAKVYFKKALKASTINKRQKAESYYALAILYFDLEDFYNASMYYDSTRSTMSDKDERYALVAKYSKDLRGIAKNIDIIYLQDSLLKIAAWPKEQLNAYAKSIIEKEKANKEKNKSASKKAGRFDRLGSTSMPSSQFGGSSSSFFAYHPNQVELGKIEFKRKWGERELEDNWRRSSKFEFGDTDIDGEEEEVVDEISDAELKRVLKNIPLTVGDKSKAHSKIENALFELGTLYKDKLNNCKKSITTLQRLMKDYAQSTHRVEAAYYLYLCNRGTNAVLADQYATIIKSEFPDSKFAKFLTDPNFSENYLSDNERVGKYYDETYQLFVNNDYEGASRKIDEVPNIFDKKNIYQAKFALLGAMCKGKTESKEAYIKALKELVKKHPKTKEKTRAQEILRFLKGDKYAFNDQLSSEEIEKFTLQDNRMHYVIVKVNEAKQKVNSNKIKISISSFNKQYFKLDKLKTKDSYLDIQSKTSLILIRRFANKEKAMVYYDTVQKNSSDFIDDNIDFEIFAITQRNYREVLKQKTTSVYDQFFKDNYLSN